MSALSELVAGRSESLGVEYKAWMDTSVNETRAKLAKHIAALANHGGGYLVFGVEDVTRQPMGETTLSRNFFTQDALAGIVRRYLEPRPQLSAETVAHDGVDYPVVIVPSHGARPITAIADGPQDDRGRVTGIRQGAIYVRAAGPESVEIRSADDWNTLLDRCLANRADLIGNIVRQSIAAPARRPGPRVEDLLLSAIDSTAADFRRQLVEVADRVGTSEGDRIRAASESFSLLGYGLVGADGELMSLDGIRSLNERASVALHRYAYNGWSSFLPLTVPERTPQIRTGDLGGRPWSYLEGMRVPDSNFIGGGFDYWRIYEAGVSVTAESYREDFARHRDGGQPTLQLLQVFFRIHSFLAHARLVGQEIPGLQQILIRMDWRGLAGRMLAWDQHRFVCPGTVADGRFIRTIALPWAELRDSYFATFRRVTLPFLEVFPPAGWATPGESVTREIVEREFARMQFNTVRLFDD